MRPRVLGDELDEPDTALCLAIARNMLLLIWERISHHGLTFVDKIKDDPR